MRKSKNKKNIYEEIPMLFNYGFVRMKTDLAFNRNFLNQLKRDIPGILSFMKSLSTMHPKRLKRRVDNAEDFDDFSKVAVITKEQYRYYKRLSKQNRIFSLSDIMPEVGDFVTLKKYPFEGLIAKIIDFNFNNHTVIVEIYPGMGSVLSLQLPFENVVYTIYEDFDESNLMTDDTRIDIDTLPEDEEPFEFEL